MQKLKFLPVFVLAAYSAEANVVSRAFLVNFKNAQDNSSINVVSSVISKSGESLKVASFSDLKGTIYTISNTATYVEVSDRWGHVTKSFKNKFSIVTGVGQALTTLAEKEITCDLPERETNCRVQVEAEGLLLAAESELRPAAQESVNGVDLNISSYKGLLNEETGVDKILEGLQTALRVKPATETLLYSDTQSKGSLSVQANPDAYNNVSLTYKGKVGFINILASSGARSVFELEAPSPDAPGYIFRRFLETEATANGTMSAAVQLKEASIEARLESADDNFQSVPFGAKLSFDSTSLKPDPTQEGYTVGDGLLAGQGESPVAYKAYWDLEAVDSADPLKNIVRTQVYKLKSAASERVIKFRSNGGQRALLTVADTPDPTKKDLSQLELEFVLGTPATAQPLDPFGPAQPADPETPRLPNPLEPIQPVDPVELFRQ